MISCRTLQAQVMLHFDFPVNSCQMHCPVDGEGTLPSFLLGECFLPEFLHKLVSAQGVATSTLMTGVLVVFRRSARKNSNVMWFVAYCASHKLSHARQQGD